MECKLFWSIETPTGKKDSETFKLLKERLGNEEANQIYNLTTLSQFVKEYGDWETAIRRGEKPFNTELGEPDYDTALDWYTKLNEPVEIITELENTKLLDATNKIITKLEGQYNNLLRSTSTNKLEIAAQLKSITEELRSKKTVLGIINYINFIKTNVDKYHDLMLNKFDTLDKGYVRYIKNLIESFDDLTQLERELITISKNGSIEDLYETIDDEIVKIKPYIAEELIPSIENVNKKRNEIIEEYKSKSLSISSSWLSMLTDKHSESDLVRMLEKIRDINVFSRWGLSAKNVNSFVLQLVAKGIAIAKRQATIIVNNDLTNIYSQQEKIEKFISTKEPSKLYSFMLETYNGELTGKEVSEYYDKPFRMSMNDMFQELREAETKFQKGRIIRNWINENLDQVKYKSFEKDFKLKKKELQDGVITNEEFLKWEEKNVTYGREVESPNGELTKPYYAKTTSEYYKPSAKWLNPQYQTIQSTPQLKEFYDFYINLKNKYDELLPYKFRKNNELLGIKKDLVDKFNDSGVKGLLDYAKDNIKFNALEEHEYGEQQDGSIVNHIPIYYTGKVLNEKLYNKDYIESIKGKYISINDVSLDFSRNLAMFSAMSNNYNELNKIIDNIEMLKDVVSESDILKTTSDGRIVLDKNELEEIAYKGSASNVFKLFEDYVSMNVYGQTKAKELGSLGKVIDKFLGFNSIVTLSFNMFTPVSNLLMGNVIRRISSIGSNQYSIQDYNKAQLQYATENPTQMITDSFSKEPKNKINLLRKLFQLETGYNETNVFRNAIKGKFNRTFDHMGEHFLSSVSMLSILNANKLFDEIQVVDGKLVLSKELNNKELQKLTFKIKEEVKSKDGAYSLEDKAAIQKYLIGRVVFNFRNWIVPTVLDRFQMQRLDGEITGIYNYQNETEEKGYYISAYQFVKSLAVDVAHAKLQVATRWNELTTQDKRNIHKFNTEMAYFIATGFLAVALKAAADDDKDNKTLNYISFQIQRLNTELGFYMPILGLKDQLKIIKSPAASVSALGNIQDLLGQVLFNVEDDGLNWKANDVYETGKKKGRLIVGDKLLRQTPLINQFYRLSDL